MLLILALCSTSTDVVDGILLSIESEDSSAQLLEFSTIADKPEASEIKPLQDPELVSFEPQSIEIAKLPLAIDPIEIELPIERIDADRLFETRTDLGESLPPSKSAGQDLAVADRVPEGSLLGEIAHGASMFGSRSGELKQQMLQTYGGTPDTEASVALGLAWLKRQQFQNGCWSLRGPYRNGSLTENRTAATAMAMLAFMGAGNTHWSGEYKNEMQHAVRWLVQQQDQQGFIASDASFHEAMYAQAQATIALCELYAMTGDSWLRPKAQLACDWAVKAQSPNGGWRYLPRSDSDTSVTGWFVMGLKSGEAAGLEVDRYVFLNVDKFLNTVSYQGTDDYGAIGYSYQPGRPVTSAMTAEGILCRQYLGWRHDVPAMARNLEFLVTNGPININDPDVYYWYYATQALHHYGGMLWTHWNDRLKVELPAAQEKQGRELGSWSPMKDRWGMTAGRLYATCMCLYSLEVYYRHMPIYGELVQP